MACQKNKWCTSVLKSKTLNLFQNNCVNSLSLLFMSLQFIFSVHPCENVHDTYIPSLFLLIWGPARGGPMLPVWILKRLVSVFINACRLLSALPSLLQFGQGRLSLVAISFYALSLLFGPCRLSELTLAGPLICFELLITQTFFDFPTRFELSGSTVFYLPNQPIRAPEQILDRPSYQYGISVVEAQMSLSWNVPAAR